jgi:hypothetical protein
VCVLVCFVVPERPLDIPRISGRRELLRESECKRSDHSIATLPNVALDDRTRRWGKGRHQDVEPKSIVNRFARVAPEWFYLLMGRFVSCKDNSTLWGGEIGATLLSSMIVTFSRMVICCGPYTPGVDVLANDLLELVWPFRIADVAQVRAAVLYGVGTAMGHLRDETMVTWLLNARSSYDSSNPITNIRFMVNNDPDSECRTLANQLSYTIAASLHAIDSTPSLLE